MKTFAAVLLLALVASACDDTKPPTVTSPTPVPAAPAPAPLPPPSATLTWNPGGGSFSCVTGLCYTLVAPFTNIGPDCATAATVTVRAYGSDGFGIQLGIDIPMGLPGASLATYLWRPGVSQTLQNLSTFNDVRSAHTVFKAFFAVTPVRCS